MSIANKLLIISLTNICLTIICSLREEPVKITKEAFRDKFQMRFKENNLEAKSEN